MMLSFRQVVARRVSASAAAAAASPQKKAAASGRGGSISGISGIISRGFATQRKTKFPPLAPEIMENLPVYEMEASDDEDPDRLIRNPVTSAHMVDAERLEVSALDSVALNPSGSAVHGRYGDLGPDVAASIPLEYLALLHPAAEGAAALRVLTSRENAPKKGTFLVYGAGQANGFAAAQMASKAGHAVVAVVGGEHSGNEDFKESVKGFIDEPGTAVGAEYALSKKHFEELVHSISTGDEGIEEAQPEEYLADFKENLLAYTEAYPSTRPAAVSEDELTFKYMEKDREHWQRNMETYLAQFPPGSPPVDEAKLDAFFSTEQYEIFRLKFWKQTSDVISGDNRPSFSPPHLVKDQCNAPETLDHKTYPGAGPLFPYNFSVLNQYFPEGTEHAAGGPIIGAAICVTPMLKTAADAVANGGKTVREKAEAMQYLTKMQRDEYGAASSVVAQAKKAGAPVVVLGGLPIPGLDSVGDPTDADVKAALAAMDIDETGESGMNYFVQVYRSENFPFYGTYAIHRAAEPLAGPRQIIVTK